MHFICNILFCPNTFMIGRNPSATVSIKKKLQVYYIMGYGVTIFQSQQIITTFTTTITFHDQISSCGKHIQVILRDLADFHRFVAWCREVRHIKASTNKHGNRSVPNISLPSYPPVSCYCLVASQFSAASLLSTNFSFYGIINIFSAACKQTLIKSMSK